VVTVHSLRDYATLYALRARSSTLLHSCALNLLPRSARTPLAHACRRAAAHFHRVSACFLIALPPSCAMAALASPYAYRRALRAGATVVRRISNWHWLDMPRFLLKAACSLSARSYTTPPHRRQNPVRSVRVMTPALTAKFFMLFAWRPPTMPALSRARCLRAGAHASHHKRTGSALLRRILLREHKRLRAKRRMTLPGAGKRDSAPLANGVKPNLRNKPGLAHAILRALHHMAFSVGPRVGRSYLGFRILPAATAHHTHLLGQNPPQPPKPWPYVAVPNTLAFGGLGSRHADSDTMQKTHTLQYQRACLLRAFSTSSL